MHVRSAMSGPDVNMSNSSPVFGLLIVARFSSYMLTKSAKVVRHTMLPPKSTAARSAVSWIVRRCQVPNIETQHPQHGHTSTTAECTTRSLFNKVQRPRGSAKQLLTHPSHYTPRASPRVYARRRISTSAAMYSKTLASPTRAQNPGTHAARPTT